MASRSSRISAFCMKHGVCESSVSRAGSCSNRPLIVFHLPRKAFTPDASAPTMFASS
ncbi:hypothetical protein Mapa_000564 [Marchantia paleacea]|nr:hypothetical protein Mapa_000564 [Marchantia paleacea]